MSRLAFLLGLLAAGAARAEGPAPSTLLGVGTDLAAEAQCLTCHGAGVGAAWAHLSSHKVLHDCKVCHALSAASGAGHASKKACGDCHSAKTHPPATSTCATCHDVHGSPNAFLVRSSLTLANGGSVPIHLTKPHGASTDGLVRAGVAGAAAGTGLCEVCHQGTAHYTAAGGGSPHAGDWCATCHSHEDGFAPAPAR